jgi:hypothetical protein
VSEYLCLFASKSGAVNFRTHYYVVAWQIHPWQIHQATPWIPNYASVLLIILRPMVTPRVNQILEDMLRACALQCGRSWDKSLSYAKFSYNNSYQESLKMTPFELLHGHRCRTSLFWSETGERRVFGPDILQEAERQVRMVRENLRVVQSRQKKGVEL